jgi:uncharacterized DUF497 family protein
MCEESGAVTLNSPRGEDVAIKRLTLTAHARIRMRDRQLSEAWVELTVRQPDWIEPDPHDEAVERRFRAINEFGGRILRVACVETQTNIRVISVMFDRNARRKP